MPRLLIANDCPEQVPKHNIDFSKALAVWSLRALWHVENEDIIVLPIAPDPGHLEYITNLLDINHKTLCVIVAPPNEAHHLSADRILNLELCNTIKQALAGKDIKEILPLTLDAPIAELAHRLGAENKLSGIGFASQGGGLLANSKAAFRAIAAGVNVPIPFGTVFNDPIHAETVIASLLLKQHVPIIIKKEFGQGCRGNEILSPMEGIFPNGGRRGLVLADHIAIKNYIAENWNWLTDNGKYQVIAERYYPKSRAIFAEFNLTEQNAQFAGMGEMLAIPIADGQVIPPQGLTTTTIAEIVDAGQRLSNALHVIGYRGMLSADTIVTPDNQVFFTEYNGRITGSTHIYSKIGARIVGNEWMQKRILLERRGWSAPSFQSAVNMLKNSGLAYDHKTHSGIILTGTFIPTRQVISYTIVAENIAAAMKLEEQLHQVSPRVVEVSI